MKRIISVFIVLALCFSLFPASVLAEKNTIDIAENDNENIEEVQIKTPASTRDIKSNNDFSFSSLTGTILGENGEKIEGVSVYIYNLDEKETILPFLKSDANGRWQSEDNIIVTGYSYLVSYYKAGYTITPDRIQVTAESEGTTVEDATANAIDGNFICNESDYTYEIEDENAVITGYTGRDTEIIIPEELGAICET